jgi:8-oxo-dGTP diphosphatase
VTIYLVRHAQAGSRHDWAGDDRDRPLSPKGLRQASGLVDQFGDRPITRVLSSPFLRCRQTVEPVADLRGVPIESTDAMAEGASTKAAIALLRSLAGTDAMLCSHGDVIPEVISALAAQGVPVNGRRSAVKGATFVIDVEHGKLASATYVEASH